MQPAGSLESGSFWQLQEKASSGLVQQFRLADAEEFISIVSRTEAIKI
jgi:hypothetical protein